MAAVLALAVVACAPLPRRAGIPTQWLPSPNYDERRPNYVVLHHTGSDDARRALRTLTDGSRTVSAHYLVVRDGTIWQLVDERARAWHAGESFWGGATDVNSASLGIELDNDGTEPFAAVQIDALLALLRDITDRYAIPAANILGHGDVAPRRKVDPSRLFPWALLAQHGFGLWCDPPYDEEAAAVSSPPAMADATGASPEAAEPDLQQALLLLQALGYDIGQPAAALAAFHRHFRQQDAAELAPDDLPLLRCLARRKAEGGMPMRD